MNLTDYKRVTHEILKELPLLCRIIKYAAWADENDVEHYYYVTLHLDTGQELDVLDTWPIRMPGDVTPASMWGYYDEDNGLGLIRQDRVIGWHTPCSVELEAYVADWCTRLELTTGDENPWAVCETVPDDQLNYVLNHIRRWRGRDAEDAEVISAVLRREPQGGAR